MRNGAVKGVKKTIYDMRGKETDKRGMKTCFVLVHGEEIPV